MIDENISTIIFYRSERGIGDACMLKPIVEKWQQLYPDSEIIVVIDKPASAVFEQSKYTIIPLERFNISDYDEAIFFNVSHCCLDYEMKRDVQKSRFEIFAEHCNVSINSCGHIAVTDAEIRHIYDRVPVLSRKANGNHLVGIVLKSMQSWRNYPHISLVWEYFNRLTMFDKTTTRIIPIILDHEQSFEDVFCTIDLDIRETIVLIGQLDLVIGVDTGLMHVAGALNIPTLWLFGPTDPRVRINFYDEAHYFWHPCERDKACWYDYCSDLNCLWKLSPWSIVRKAKKILKSHDNTGL